MGAAMPFVAKRASGKGTGILYTYMDEGPMLATRAFYPIGKGSRHHANVGSELKDFSVVGRVLAPFSECLWEVQRTTGILTELGELARSGQAKRSKLPNISASVLQLKGCTGVLQMQGFALPDHPEVMKNEKGRDFKARYG